MNKLLRDLRCQHCRGKFKISFETGKAKIFKCKCFEYPFIEGILYLKRDTVAKDAVRFIKKGNVEKALRRILNVRKKILVPLYFLTRFGFLNKKFSNIIGLKNFLSLLKFCSYDEAWVKYLTHRTKEDYFNLSVALSNLIENKNDKFLDIGLGLGQYLPHFYKKLKSQRIIGLDSSFLNLYIARIFYARMGTLLISCDVTAGIPFVDNNFEFLHMNDTFHHIRDKDRLLREIKRVLNKEGIFICIHTLSIKRLRDIFGISPNILRNKLSLSGFKKSSFYSDKFLWQKLRSGKVVDLEISENLEKLNPFEGYSFIASKFFPKVFSINKNLISRFAKDRLDQLEGKRGLKKFSDIVFISPHLDDAVLSCANIIKEIRDEGINVKIITVFTKASNPPYSPQASEYLKMCKYRDAKKLFRERISEDKRASRFLDVEALHLDFVDAAWRKNNNGSFHYPNSLSQFSGVLAPEDLDLIDKLKRKLEKIVGGDKSLLFIPLGIGGHADHVLVRNAVIGLTKRTFFWEDFPYNRDRYSRFKILFKKREFKFAFKVGVDKESELKQRAIMFYKSQVNSLFKQGKIPEIPERYYKLKDFKV